MTIKLLACHEQFCFFEITGDELPPNFTKGELLLGDSSLAVEPKHDVVLVYPDGRLLLVPSGANAPDSPEAQNRYVLTYTYQKR